MTLNELLRPRTEKELRARLFGLLSPNFDVTDFHPGGVARTLIEIDATVLADVEQMVQQLGVSGFLETAEGDWLDALAQSHYQLLRKPATFALGVLKVQAAPGFGPYTLAPGQVWVSSVEGLRFNNLEAATIVQSGTAELLVRAESPGAAYNVPNNTITVLHTPLPGLSVGNSTGWLLQAGADQERDTALRERCRLQWPALGSGATRDAYKFWAYTASSSVSKVRVLDQHPRGQGTVDVVLWGDGGIGASVVADVDAYIQARRPVTADVLVYSALERVVPVTAQLVVETAYLNSALREAAAGLARLQREIPIGGTLYKNAIVEELMLPRGVVNVVLTNPATDITMGNIDAITLLQQLTTQGV
jgi:uncharacterized phage protein gp47/JayE